MSSSITQLPGLCPANSRRGNPVGDLGSFGVGNDQQVGYRVDVSTNTRPCPIAAAVRPHPLDVAAVTHVPGVREDGLATRCDPSDVIEVQMGQDDIGDFIGCDVQGGKRVQQFTAVLEARGVSSPAIIVFVSGPIPASMSTVRPSVRTRKPPIGRTHPASSNHGGVVDQSVAGAGGSRNRPGSVPARASST